MEPFVYQIFHLYGGRVRLLDEHIERLDAASRMLFNRPYRPDRKALEQRLLAEAEQQRYTADYSSFVRVELFDTGEEICYGVGQSYYAGYAVRSVRPKVITLAYEMPLLEEGTVASLAAAKVAQARAQAQGADDALRIDHTGRVRSMGEATLYGIREGFLIAPSNPVSATDTLVRKAADRLRLRTVLHPILQTELHLYDELFAVDYRGITSISHCNNRPLMTLRVERLAEAMNAVVSVQ